VTQVVLVGVSLVQFMFLDRIYTVFCFVLFCFVVLLFVRCLFVYCGCSASADSSAMRV